MTLSQEATLVTVAVTHWNANMKEEKAQEITEKEGFSLNIKYLDSPQLQTPE